MTSNNINTRNQLSTSPILVSCMEELHWTYSDLLAVVKRIDFYSSRRKNGNNKDSTSTGATGSRSSTSSSSSSSTKTEGKDDTFVVADDCLKLPIELVERIVQYFTIESVNHDTVRVIKCSSHDGQFPLSSILDSSENTWWISGENSMPEWFGKEYVEFDLVGTSTYHNRINNNNTINNDADDDDNINDNNSNDPIDKSKPSLLCRLRKISIKIPPFPQGPLSVGFFHVEVPRTNTNKNSQGKSNGKETNVISNNRDEDTRVGVVDSDVIQQPQEKEEQDNDDDANDDNEWYRISPNFEVEHNKTGYQEFLLLPPIGADVNRIRIVCTANQMGRLSGLGSVVSPFVHDLIVNRAMEQVGYYSIRFD